MRSPSPRDRARRAPTRNPVTRVLVVCEGQTEEAYFRHLNELLHGGGVAIKAVVSPTPAPQEIVDTAKKYRQGDTRHGIEPDAYDQVWAVFDWDEHTDEVAQARRAATAAGVGVALSSPCFEVWLLWHFKDYTRPGCLPRDAAQDLRAAWPEFEKGKRRLDVAALSPQGCSDALRRAAAVDALHAIEGRSYPENRPSSGVHVLVTRIIEVWQDVLGRGTDCPIG